MLACRIGYAIVPFAGVCHPGVLFTSLSCFGCTFQWDVLPVSVLDDCVCFAGRGSEWKVFETVRAACSHDASVVSLKSSMGASSAGSLFSEKDSFGRLSDESVCRGDVCHGEVDSACW